MPRPASPSAPAAPKTTPMFAQYLGIKAEHPNALLFYRMGDFYEMFFDDAVITAKELQLTLTSRSKDATNPVPMCGVPWHALDSYLSQLIAKGYNVAICEQVEDPKQSKGLVRRAVTRIVTPGTVLDDANLITKDHNYLASIYWNEKEGQGGLSWADSSTGEWTGIFSKKKAVPQRYLHFFSSWTFYIDDLAIFFPVGRFTQKIFASFGGIGPFVYKKRSNRMLDETF